MRVAYFADATDDVVAVIRAALPSGWDFDVMPDGGVKRPADLADVDVILAGNVRVDRWHIAAAPNLRLVQKTGVGYDSIDIEAMREAGIPVAVCPVGSVESGAEHTILLILAVARRLSLTASAVASGGWPRWDYQSEMVGLNAATVGILGFGRIGQAVGKRLLAFGVQLRAMRRPPDPAETFWWEDQGVQFVDDVGALFEGSDIVSLHVPLTVGTRGLVDRTALERMKPGGIVVNMARGGVLVEADLVDLLRTGRLGGAGLDTLATEPPDGSSPLVGMRNVVITPHLGSGGVSVVRAKMPEIVANIRRRMEGEELRWRVV